MFIYINVCYVSTLVLIELCDLQLQVMEFMYAQFTLVYRSDFGADVAVSVIGSSVLLCIFILAFLRYDERLWFKEIARDKKLGKVS